MTSAFPTSAHPNVGRPTYQRVAALSALADVAVFVADSQYGWLRPWHFWSKAHGRPEPLECAGFHYVSYRAVPMVSRAVNGLVLARRLMPLLKRFQPDVVLGYYVHPEGTAAVEAAGGLGVPSIVYAVGSDLRQIKEAVTRWSVRRTLRRASGVITVSEELRTHALALGADPLKTRTIRNGCDTGTFRVANRAAARAELGIAPSARLIAFTGTLFPLKGIYPLMDAFEALSRKDASVELAMIGDGPQRAELLQRSPGFGGRLRLPGPVKPADLARWLAACDVFCLPSYSEGCPNAVIEALCCGRPVVASAVGGIPELLTPENGLTVPPGDSVRLAEALWTALNGSWHEEGIASAARRTWQDTARDILQLCHTAIEESGKKRSAAGK